jgi:Protein of unknown function (DUF3433)
LENSTLTIPVEAFVPKYNCEIAAITDARVTADISESLGIVEATLNFTARSQSCSTQVSVPIELGLVNDPVPERLVYATPNPAGCDAGSAWPNSATNGNSDITLLMSADLRFEPLITPTFNKSAGYNITGWSSRVAAVSALLCRPGYTLHDAEVIVDTSLPAGENVVRTRLLQGKNETIPGLANGSVSYAYIEALDAFHLQNLPPLPAIAGATQTFEGDILWNIMSLQNGGSSLEPFLNPQILQQTAEGVFQGIVAQLAHQLFVESRMSPRRGTRQYFQERLQMKSVSTLVIAIAFALLLVCIVIIFYSRAVSVIPGDPTSIATQAAIFTASASTQRDLSNLGHACDADLKRKLYKSSYESYMELNPTPSFNISRNRLGDIDLALDKAFEYWRPFPVSWWFITLVTMATCALITVLQVLQHISERTSGITSIHISSAWAHEFFTVLPAATMISISGAYKAAYGTFVSILPYSMMHLGAVTASRSLMMRTAGRLHVINAVNGIRLRVPSLTFISTATFLGTFLSTIVAALYQIESYSAPTPVQFRSSDRFDFDFRTDNLGDLPNDNGAGLIFSLIEQQNASYPPYVYEELVYPKFSLPTTEQVAAEGAAVQVEIPAFRAALRCDFAPTDSFEFEYFQQNPRVDEVGGTLWSIAVNASFVLPPECHWPGRYSLLRYATVNLRHDTTTGYGSALVDILWNWIYRQTNSTCYTTGFMHGFFQYEMTQQSNITLMNCYQDIESLNTTTTFLPSMRIDPNDPPILHEDTRKVVASNRLYRLSDIMDYNIEDFWIKGFDDDAGSSGSFDEDGDVPLDPFFQSIIWGPDGVPADELVGVQNRAKLFNATQHMYRKYMALLIHTSMRQAIPSNASSSPPTYSGHLLDPSARRLIQNSAPKLALQIMLAVMLLLAAAAYVFTPMRNVLPHNPCTIAGVMTLLTGSELCTRDVIPIGTEFADNTQLRRTFDGYIFSLGWFPAGDNGRTGRFGVDVGKAERSGRTQNAKSGNF